MSKPKQASPDEAKRIGDSLGVDWDLVDLEQFRMGLLVELEHGTRDPETNVTDDDVSLTWLRFKNSRSLAPQKMFLNIEKG